MPDQSDARISNILCPFCSAAWTEEMINFYNTQVSQGCVTCGYGSGVETSFKIVCHSCERLIYQKDGQVIRD